MIQRLIRKVRVPNSNAISNARSGSIVLLSLIWLSIDAIATPPERLPPYSHCREMREDSTLRAIAFADQQHGVVCGDRGTILSTDDGGLSWVIQNSGVDCRLSDVVWMDDQRVVIVGGGYDRITQIGRSVVLFSPDGGKHWRQIANDLPVLTKIHRRQDGSLTATGDWSHAMLTDRFQSHDDAKTWIANFDSRTVTDRQTQPTPEQMARWVTATGIPVAIRDATQVDETTLFAVGDHGVILASGDAGRTWLPRRGKGRQTSVLFVARDAVSVAWGMLGKEAIEHRNRVSLLIHQGGKMPIELPNQVATTLGGANADLIDVKDSGVSADGLTTVANQWIAIHRPSVLVVDHSLDVAVQDAFIQSATAAGVSRVVIYRHGTGSTVIHRDALLPKSGVLVSDLASDAKQWIAPHDSIAKSIALQFHYDVAASHRHGDAVTGGIDLHPGQQLTATLPPTSRRMVQIIQARRTQSTRVKGLISKSPSPIQFADSLKTMLNQTARDDQFRLAWSIYVETTGQETSPAILALQQTILGEIATRFPATSAGQWAQLRLDSRNNSIEWNRLKRMIGDPSESFVASTSSAIPVSPFQEPRGGEVRQASAVTPVVTPTPDRVNLNWKRSSKDPIRGVDLAWEYHPMVLLSREASRQRGDDGELLSADGPSSEIKRLGQADKDDWSRLVQSGGSKSVVARSTATPPKLDGILDDPCWESALSTAGHNRIRFSYDDEFLYVAFETSAVHMRPDASAAQARLGSRDHDLSPVDRFQLRIDTDRDLLTSYRFAVSASGRTFDAVDGNPSWNPTWYRQIRVDRQSITIEMAILRRDLADLPIHTGESWYVSPQTLVGGTDAKPLVVPDPSEWLRVNFHR